MQGFESVQQELHVKRQQLEQELSAAQGRVAEIRADLERVHEALGALVGTRKKGRGRSRKKPTSTVKELQRHIADVRERKPFASAHELQEEVRSLVRESGGSLTGFPRQFAEALVSSPGYSAGHDRASSQPVHAPEAGPAPQAPFDADPPHQDHAGDEPVHGGDSGFLA
jgi:hypothetical protein